MWPIWTTDGSTPSSPSTEAEAAPAPPPPEPPRRTRSQLPSISLHPAATEEERFEAVRLQAQEAVRPSRALGRLTPSQVLQRIRSRSRGSPSPSPNTHPNNAFNFDAIMDPEQLREIISTTIAATSAGQASNTAAIVQAAVDAAMANQAQTQLSLRKPSFPPFDPKDIEQWLRRVEAAFDRLNITSPRFKLAHLDEKLVDKDPTISDIMSSAPTQATYDLLLSYLRKKHGRTIKQMVESVMQVPSREGRCPSQLWSIMKQKAGKVTLDDIMKSQLMKAMPPTVREHLQTKTKGISGKELADLCDEFFDSDGKLLESTSASGVNSVRSAKQPQSSLKASEPTSTPSSTSTEPPTSHFTATFEDEPFDNDVNAVRFRQGQKQQFRVNNSGSSSSSRGRTQSRGRNIPNEGRYESRSGNSNKQTTTTTTSEKREAKCCFYHVRFGKEAKRCEPGCMMHSTFSPPKDQASR